MLETLNGLKISRLQKYLSALRQIAGWSAEDLGDLIGVTRQTIVNLENSSAKMSKVQYIAIRAVFDAEAKDSDNQTLQKALSVFIDSDDMPEAEKDKLRDEVNATARRVGKRKGSSAVSQAILSSVIATVLLAIPLTNSIGLGFWTMEILKELKKRKR